MILYPPTVFDANEWFILVVGALNLALAFWLPKRFSPIVVAAIGIFNFYMGQTTDFIIGKPPYEFYRYNDRSEYEIFDALLYILIYPFIAYFALYIYDCRRFTGWRLVGYVLLCALLTTGFELIAVHFHVFTYLGWKPYYSAITYMLVYIFNILLLHFLYRYIPHNNQ